MAQLLQFTVGNFRSIYEKRTISLVPQSIQDPPKESVIANGKYRYMTTAAIYGANSSGKSNVAMAFGLMNHIVQQSVKLNDGEELNYEPFLLAENSALEPTFLEIIYLDDNNDKFRYGFEYDKSRILSEWLFITRNNKRKEDTLFLRDEDGIGINEELFIEGEGFEEKTNDNRLFLSLVSQLGGKISKSVMSFFHSGYNVISGLSSFGYDSFTEQMFDEKDNECGSILDFFKKLQLGFEHIETEKNETIIPDELFKSLPDSIKTELSDKKITKIDIFSIHNVYSKEGEVLKDIRFDLSNRESSGTNKIFKLAGPIFDTLKKGKLLVIDELDAKMHPLISQQIIRLFVNPKTNPKHAQLLFTTHDTNLLSSHLLRRDQIWFTEKDKRERTDLYNLMQIVLPDGSKPRSDGNMERNYIRGRYGAIPYFHPELEE